MLKDKKPLRIALLGWGSLIWDSRPEFDEQHGEWLLEGPQLKLEFSRISKSRDGALTLVIDTDHGADCQVAYAMSERHEPEDAICDLRSREGTIMKRIGFYFADKCRTCVPAVPETIPPWAEAMKLDVVVWTGLTSNFESEKKQDFRIENAIRHLQGLSPEGKAQAANYVWRAPEFVRTPLRKVLQGLPWFAEQGGRLVAAPGMPEVGEVE